MTEFRDAFDAAEALTEKLPETKPDAIFAVMPNGAPSAVALARVTKSAIRPLRFERESGVVAANLEGLSTSSVIWIADDGVESGTAARAIGTHFQSAGFKSVHLMVPVCAKDAMAQLQFLYASIVAARSPLMTRSLHWHYAQMPDLEIEAAEALIDPYR